MSGVPDKGWTIERFLAKLASDEPAPGGGSAAALAGCLGCGLGGMVCRIIAKRRSIGAGTRRRLGASVRELDRISRELQRLMREDARAYARLVRAFRLQRGIASARLAAIRAPLRICEAAAAGYALLLEVEPLAGSLLKSDLRAGRALLRGAFQAADVTVQINFMGKDVPASARALEKRLGRLRKRMR